MRLNRFCLSAIVVVAAAAPQSAMAEPTALIAADTSTC